MRQKSVIDTFTLADALARHFQGMSDEQDEVMIRSWFDANVENRLLYESLKKDTDRQIIYGRMLQYDSEAALARVHRRTGKAGNRKYIRLTVVIFLAAAVLAILLVLRAPKNLPVDTKGLRASNLEEILPARPSAVLVLGNGTQVSLDERDSSFTQGADIAIRPGSVSYQSNKNKDLTVQLHTLSTPKGGEYHLTLSDGTGVWLNAGSSIRFPSSFQESARAVEVSGEVYFEVAKDGQRPFRVTSGTMKIDVLGTSFNVSAYPREQPIITLMSGAVKLSQEHSSLRLHVGESGYFNDGKLQRKPADTLTVMGWKRGVFRFRKTPMEQLTAQLERYYNITFEFNQNYDRQRQVNGEISRAVPLSKVLSMLEKTGIGHFQLKEGKVLVLPAN